MSWDAESFKKKVESQHQFPGIYLFKFVIPHEIRDEVVKSLPEGEMSFRSSSNNRYVSITLKVMVNTSDEVVEVYRNIYKFKGVVAL
jgi:hypothetical protein